MNYAEICIIKRDGKREDFSISKIKNAIGKAFSATGIQNEQQLIADVTMSVISQFTNPTITVEEIQDLVEKALMKVRPEVAKKYIIYREWRNTERDKKTQMKHVMDGIVAIDKNDVNLSNANMSSHTPAGQMMTFASEVTKDYTYKYLLPKRFAEAHQLGDVHIHDLDYYPTRTSSTADRQSPPSTSSWQKEWQSLSANIWLRSSIFTWRWRTEHRRTKKQSAP